MIKGSGPGEIIRSNFFTYLNLIFPVLTVLLVSLQAWNSLTFLQVVLANILIGIIQQLRAKRVPDKLSLLDITKDQAVRNGRETEVLSTDLVQDDVVLLTAGQQIPANEKVVEESISFNRSLLTGEADEISKQAGNILRSGSFIISGKAYAELTSVGEESKGSGERNEPYDPSA